MRSKNILNLGLMTAALLVAPLAQAQFAGYQNQDAVLFVWANGHDTINFDLGSVSQFNPTTSLTVSDFNPSVVEADLGVSSLSGLSFNVGAANTPAYTPYATWTISPSALTIGTAYTAANALGSYFGALLGAGPNNYSIEPYSSTLAYDHNNQSESEFHGIASFGSEPGLPYTTLPGTLGDGSTSGSASLNLYQESGGPGVDLGSFTLNNDGALTFTGVSAVPEPSTYALGGLGLLMTVWNKRSKRKHV